MKRLVLSLSILALVVTAAGSILIASAHEPGDQVQVTGFLEVQWGETEHFTLYDPSDGSAYVLNGAGDILAEQGGYLGFIDNEIVVNGTLSPGNVIEVTSIQRIDVIAPRDHVPFGRHISGHQPYVTVVCRFGDMTDVTPEPVSHYEAMMDLAEDYFTEVSYGVAVLNASEVVGWIDMPNPYGDYLDDDGEWTSTARVQAMVDCAGEVEDEINFHEYVGIQAIFNESIDGNWGGSFSRPLNGESGSWGGTWLHWSVSPGTLMHEIGHSFGLPHSSGPYGTTYDSQWDVMSNSSGANNNDTGGLGPLGAHTIAIHKYALGWIRDDQRYVASNETNQLIFLERLAQPNTPLGDDEYLMAHIPIPGSVERFYTVESRFRVGYDNSIPLFEAALMHDVDYSREGAFASRALVVDGIDNGNPNDIGAHWQYGDLFEDEEAGVSLATVHEEDTGFWILINPDLELTISVPDEGIAGEDVIVDVEVSASGQPADFLEGMEVILAGSMGGDFQVLDSNGRASFTASSTFAGQHLVIVQFAYLFEQSEIELQPGPPATIGLFAGPQTQRVGEGVVLEALVTDEFGNLVADGTEVTFEVDRDETASLVNGDSWTATTVGGSASIVYTNTLSGADTVTAIAGEVSEQIQVEWLPGPPHSVEVSVDPDVQEVAFPVEASALVQDEFGNSVTDGTPVMFQVERDGIPSETAFVINGDPDDWSAETQNGIASIDFTNTLSGIDTATAFVDGVDPENVTTANVEWLPGPPADVQLFASTDVQTVDAPVLLSTIVEDQFGNRVLDGTEVIFDIAGSTAEAPTRTDGGSGLIELTSNGEVSLAYTKLFPGTDTITASAGDDPVITSDPVTVEWVLPEPTFGISVTAQRFFSFQTAAMADPRGGVAGMVIYHGPDFHVSTRQAATVVVDGDHAIIYGLLDNGQFVRVDLERGPDTARVRLIDFDSGDFAVHRLQYR